MNRRHLDFIMLSILLLTPAIITLLFPLPGHSYLLGYLINLAGGGATFIIIVVVIPWIYKRRVN